MPIMDETDVSLPKATLSKMIRELTPSDLRFGGESLEMLIECCTEFVNLLSTESNEVSTKEKKNTIHPEHVLQALEELGFGEFVPEVREAWNSWKEETKNKASMRPRGHKTAADAAGISEEEQILMQQSLFAEAKARSNSYQEPASTGISFDDRCAAMDLSTAASESPQVDRICTNHSPSDHIASSICTDLASRPDILPICSLPPSPIASDFTPSVINSSIMDVDPQPTVQQNDTSEAVSPTVQSKATVTTPLDFRNIAMSQPVIVLHDGVQQVVPWRMLIAQLQPNADGSGDSSLQMPTVSTQSLFMQPSFPETIHNSTVPAEASTTATPAPTLHSEPSFSPDMSTAFHARAEMDIQTSPDHD